MDQTVVGMFDTAAQAQQAAQKLAAVGFGLESVDVSHAKYPAGSGMGSGDSSDYQNTSGTAVEGAADAVGRTAHQAQEGIGGFFSSLFGSDEDTDDTAQRYTHAARSTSSIVTVHCHSAENAHQAAQLLDEAGAVDVDERAAATGYQPTGNTQPNRYANQNATTGTDGLKAEVIEENLQVGKRVEQTGGVRLRSRIVEKPVEASVRLREEHVVVNRIPVNRPASEADFKAFQEGQVELTESAERAVVAKEAHVVEEVSLGKQVTEHEQIIKETVRHTEVDVEQIPGATTTTNPTTMKTTDTNPSKK